MPEQAWAKNKTILDFQTGIVLPPTVGPPLHLKKLLPRGPEATAHVEETLLLPSTL
jgi:hypothetical protein